MYEHTHTHTPSDASTWKWNQVGGGGARRGQGTHTHSYKNTLGRWFACYGVVLSLPRALVCAARRVRAICRRLDAAHLANSRKTLNSWQKKHAGRQNKIAKKQRATPLLLLVHVFAYRGIIKRVCLCTTDAKNQNIQVSSEFDQRRHPRLWPPPPPFISQLCVCVCVWSHQIISLIFYRSGFIVIHLPDNMLIHPAQPFGLYFTETTPALQPEENTKKKKKKEKKEMKKKIKCHTFCKHWSSPGPASSEFALNVFLSDKRFDCGGRRCKTSTRNTFKNPNAENMRWFASLHYLKGLN